MNAKSKKLYLLVSAPKGDGDCDTIAFSSYNARARYIVDELMKIDRDDEGQIAFYTNWEPEFGNWNDARDPDMRWYLSEVELDVQPVAEKEAAKLQESMALKTFTLCVQQFVEQVGTIEVQATNLEFARAAFDSMWRKGDLPEVDWRDGDDVRDFKVYAIEDEDMGTVWEG